MRSTCTKNRLHSFVPTALGEVDNLFDQVFGPKAFQPSAYLRAPLSYWEADEHFHIELDAPGVAQGDVELTFDKGSLKVALERKQPESERANYHNERLFGSVERTITLPDSADGNSISAELNSGVLHVTIAKRLDAQPKRIEVKTG